MEVELSFISALLRAIFNQKHIAEVVDEERRKKLQTQIDSIWGKGTQMVELEKLKRKEVK